MPVNKSQRKWFEHAKDRKDLFMGYMKEHNWLFYRPASQSGNYKKDRTLQSIREKMNFDITAHLQKAIKQKGQIRVLDVGFGHGHLSRDIKQTFGNKTHLTGLNLASSEIPEKVRKDLAKTSPQDLQNLHEFQANSKLVDTYAVSLFENFTSQKKFDVIIDMNAAAVYSPYKQRVLQQLTNLLNVNGTAIVYGAVVQAHFKGLGKNSAFAKERGYYLEFTTPKNVTAPITIITKRLQPKT
ncbi:MAG: methyltransferase [archaeon]|jgi:SAM-dependent methyltransferase